MISAKWQVITIAAALLLLLSSTPPDTPATWANSQYDRALDTMLAQLRHFEHDVKLGATTTILHADLFRCRNAYKRAEFFVDVFAPHKARAINGPDLLKIDEENPGDSIKAHGLQVVETIVYAESIDQKILKTELQLLTANIKQLRNDADKVYYFKDDKIWEAMRLGVYRIISMGLSGFDVPLSGHALPETRAALSSIRNVAFGYRQPIGKPLLQRGDSLFRRADSYLAAHNNFNTFDRLAFIRNYLNPVSDWLTDCSGKLGYINTTQLSPLSALASNLFAADIMDIRFFSPNEDYRMTPERVALGKRLFYDALLSGDGNRSCATCHQPAKAFTDGLAKPPGLTGNKVLLRNTPTLWNSAYQTAQFYDSRTKTLENQLSAVVHNTEEMNGSLQNSIPRLRQNREYDSLFRVAYGSTEGYICEYNIANAISSYVRSLTALNSRFDKYMRHESNDLTAAEQNGFNLFMGKAHCGTCHYAPVFNGLIPPLYEETESEKLGVPATADARSVLDADPGKAAFTKLAYHQYAFRTPTVRNSALTAPYMHNGVFARLDEVMAFYNDGGGAGRGIDLPTQTLPADKLGLTKKEMKDIVAFLGALSDTTGVQMVKK